MIVFFLVYTLLLLYLVVWPVFHDECKLRVFEALVFASVSLPLLMVVKAKCILVLLNTLHGSHSRSSANLAKFCPHTQYCNTSTTWQTIEWYAGPFSTLLLSVTIYTR